MSEQKEENGWLCGAAMPASHAFLQTVLSVSEGTRVRRLSSERFLDKVPLELSLEGHLELG